MESHGRWMMVLLAVSAGAALAKGAGFDEDFSTDPIGSGRWTLPDGGANRFTYHATDRTLTAHYNSLQPTARLVRAVGLPATAGARVRVNVDFEIRSDGFAADPDGFAQIAFGMMNQATTGSDRTSPQGNSFDMFGVDYFPNVSTLYGGPTLSPTIITSDLGTGLYGAILFEWGSETMLDDAGESPLPLDTRLVAKLLYRRQGDNAQAILRILQGDTPLPINAVGTGNPPGSGGPDGDATTIVTNLGSGRFIVDAFGLLLWQDYWAGSTPSVRADVIFRHVQVSAEYPADLDGDSDVDLVDFGAFQACFNGPNRPPAADGSCDAADFDGDSDVDLVDFGTFQDCFNGPNRLPTCS